MKIDHALSIFYKDPTKYLIGQLKDRKEWTLIEKAINCDQAWQSTNNDYIIFDGDYIVFGNLEVQHENRVDISDNEGMTVRFAKYLLFGAASFQIDFSDSEFDIGN